MYVITWCYETTRLLRRAVTRCSFRLSTFQSSVITVTTRRDESSRKEESEKKRHGEECWLKSTRSSIIFWLWKQVRKGSDCRQLAEGEYDKPAQWQEHWILHKCYTQVASRQQIVISASLRLHLACLSYCLTGEDEAYVWLDWVFGSLIDIQ